VVLSASVRRGMQELSRSEGDCMREEVKWVGGKIPGATGLWAEGVRPNQILLQGWAYVPSLNPKAKTQ
jgi:hypothetical protein